MVHKIFDKKTSGGTVKNKNIPNKLLEEELHKPITQGADRADMQLISKFNKGICFLLCVVDIFSKYAWVIPLKDKKVITITNAFQNFLKESNRKPNELCVDKVIKF